MKQNLINLFSSPFFYLLLIGWGIGLVLNDRANYKLERWASFNMAFEELNILNPNSIGGYNWLGEGEIVGVLKFSEKVKTSKAVSDLLIKHPINSESFIKEYELNYAVISAFIFSVPLIIIFIFIISSISYLNEDWDFNKTMKTTVNVLLFIIIIGTISNLRKETPKNEHWKYPYNTKINRF